MENSKIEWCDHTFNPWEGCTKVGPGCDHCYAETRNNRFGGGNWGPGAPRRRTSEANWKKPLKWNQDASQKGVRYRVFCASLADWLDNEIHIEWLMDLLELIWQTPELDWLLLTKRIGNCLGRLEAAQTYFHQGTGWPAGLIEWIDSWVEGNPPSNVWLGATVVNQKEADRDIPKLLESPGNVRFLSMEPLLGEVSLRWLNAWPENAPTTAMNPYNRGPTDHLDGLRLIDWVIVGGESGPGARPLHPRWVRSLRDQCVAAGVPFLFKQWGEWAPDCLCGRKKPCAEAPRPEPGPMGCMFRCGKKYSGRTLDGKAWNQIPEEVAE